MLAGAKAIVLSCIYRGLFGLKLFFSNQGFFGIITYKTITPLPFFSHLLTTTLNLKEIKFFTKNEKKIKQEEQK